ncbi:MAG TPA: glycosyltransferase family 4 protein [Blastocatellia bacterium]|nr:glycosyltransferase family 4 protein [Blastocatellia bacterium]
MNSDKPNLLILTSSFPTGTTDETCGYIRDFARSVSVDFNVKVLAPADRNAQAWPEDLFALVRSSSPLPEWLDPFQASIDFNSLRSQTLSVKLASAISFAAFFKDAIKLASRADVICSHWLVPSGFIGALLSRMLNKPHIAIEHSGALHLLAGMRGGARLARFIIDGCNRVVTVSEDLKQKLLALCPDAGGKAEVIPMGVQHCEAMKNIQSESETTILFIGRLTEIKGVDVLLKAVQQIDGAQLLIAGDGEQRNTLETLAQNLSVNAKFLGQVEATRRSMLLSSCAAIVIPSRVLADGRTEGTPVVCLEAMAAGLPVVASSVGGLAEVIIDGHNGLLFEPENHAMLAEKLMLVSSNAALRRKLSRNAHLTASDYAWSRIGTRFSELIKGTLENKPNRNQRSVAFEKV